MSIVAHLKDVAQGKAALGDARSSRWPAVRKAFLLAHPVCAVCGGKDRLQVHHKKPFHLDRLLELDVTNLITLCEGSGTNCHLTFGHLGNFKSFNRDVANDAQIWNRKMKERP